MDINANLNGAVEGQHTLELDKSKTNGTILASTQESLEKSDSSDSSDSDSFNSSLPCVLGWKLWWKQYLWEGQSIQNSVQLDAVFVENELCRTLLTKYRRGVAILIPLVIVHFLWWSLAIKHEFFHLYPERYALVLTMVFASFFAGLTSVGGGAIAFPVLTVILHVSPIIARDFSLLIQSVGMTSASFTILFMQVHVEWYALIVGSCGGLMGLIVGLEYIEYRMSGPMKKMIFCSFMFSFAISLFFLNRYKKRKTFQRIVFFNWWKALVLLLTGFIGGIFSSCVGSGLDICSLGVLTLFFRVTEKTATPTAVILMAGNSMLGVFWRQAIQQTISIQAWQYVAVCAPVVSIGAPLGSLVGSHFHRLVLACVINMTVATMLISAFVLVPLDTTLIVVTVTVIIGGALVFFVLTLLGQKLLNHSQGQIDMLTKDKEAEEIGNKTQTHHPTCISYL